MVSFILAALLMIQTTRNHMILNVLVLLKELDALKHKRQASFKDKPHNNHIFLSLIKSSHSNDN